MQFSKLLNAACGLVFALLLPGCMQSDSKPISIAAHIWPGYELLFLAHNEGWLDPSKVRIIETASATESLQALADGRVNGAALTLDEMLAARAKGMPLTAIAVFDISSGADAVISRPGIKELSGIKGKRIGFEQGAVGSLMLANMLIAAKLAKEDIKLAPLTINQHRTAWANNEVDVLITYEPVAGQLLKLGANRLFDSRQIPNTIVDVLVIHNGITGHEHSDAIQHLVSVHFQALNYLSQNPQDAAYRMATHLGLPVAEVLPAFKGLLLPDAEENHRMLGGAAPQLLDTARKVSALMVQEKLLPRADTLAALASDKFLPLSTSDKP